ncbi:MAG TPA: hypothetical protein VHC22_20660 [Pirellulales bacterium]|nr:hypothetical protein [Pirellulales bacterium]
MERELGVGGIDDPVGTADRGLLGRFYIRDSRSKPVSTNGHGRLAAKPDELEQAVMATPGQQSKAYRSAREAVALKEGGDLRLRTARAGLMGSLMVMVMLSSGILASAGDRPSEFPVLDDEQAWRRLPPLASGERQTLPVWARLLADSLPRTTAAMLELDAAHRARNPLGPVLAAKTRGEVARANRCAWTIAMAEADLRRAEGALPGTEAEDRAPASQVGELSKTTTPDRLVLAFARRLTLEADTITDEEVARLTDVIGEAKLVALVLLVAHANFQDRLVSALGTVADLGDPPLPLAARFAKVGKDGGIAVPERTMPAVTDAPAVPEHVDDPEWREFDFTALQRNLDSQRSRDGRIRVPAWEDVVATIPAEQRPKHPVRILWTLVCRGYQPELAAGWSACLRTFAEEAQQDRVFEESVFWVITRTIHCFY